MVAFKSPMLLSITPYPCSASKLNKFMGSPGWTLERIEYLSLEPYKEG